MMTLMTRLRTRTSMEYGNEEEEEGEEGALWWSPRAF